MKLIPEWYEHQYCLIAWPCNKDLYGKIINKARDEVANVINEIAKTEHVIVLSNKEDINEIQNKKSENVITPNVNETLKINIVSREDSLKNSKRIKIENNNIIGSLNLKGGLIDDISFKKHKQNSAIMDEITSASQVTICK